ncbi:acyltransferase family protein [Kitasatospora sp. NPDC101155]|uniref:acyltransferase family protein n=1 Tax=Kitasatospora sp. NPDC101155 TaxID=3364097 RepID=UPI003817A1A9
MRRIELSRAPRGARTRRHSKAESAQARLGWLDALRGLAALAVALHHFGLRFFIPHGMALTHHFDLGLFGVMLFFLVSGYIVPASLERRGDMQAFWVGRVFRIYPALIVGFVAALVILPSGHNQMIDRAVFEHPLLSLGANGLLLQDLLGVPNAISIMWSLTYEMVFYYFVSALFVLRKHRQSGPIAVGFATCAVLLGGVLTPANLARQGLSTENLILAAGLVVAMGLFCAISGNPQLTRTGALLLGVLGLVLAFGSSRSAMFETMMIFATMFAGTVVYRAEHGQIDRIQAFAYCAFVFLAGVLGGRMYNHGDALWRTWTTSWMAWSFAYAGAWIMLVLGMALRKRRFPKALTWLGTVSYSVYLLHWLVIDGMDWLHGMPWLFLGTPAPTSTRFAILFTLTFLAATLVAAYLMYRLVEVPFQKLGRRFLTWLKQHTGGPADARGAGTPVPAQVAPAVGAPVAPGSASPAPVTPDPVPPGR